MEDRTISDREREVAYEVAKNAMVMGWDKAILNAAREFSVTTLEVKIILNKAAEYNSKADPSGRIPELEDWLNEKRGRSERSQSSKLHLLSPGLRAYMEARASKNASHSEKKSKTNSDNSSQRLSSGQP